MSTGETEHDDQARVFAWAELARGAYPELDLLFAIPNGAKLPWHRDKSGRRYSPEARKLKAEGLRSGVPDTCLAVPRGPYHGMFLELKHGDNKPSPNQINWINGLRAQGYYVEVAWGWEEAIQKIKDYLEERF